MKLYATIESNRAKKGQGGDYLDIEVKGEDQSTILELKIRPETAFDGSEYYLVTGYAIQPEHAPGRRSEHYIKYEIAKGEKQKGEKCEDDGGEHVYIDGSHICHKCLKTR